jgi:hypothetical protein
VQIWAALVVAATMAACLVGLIDLAGKWTKRRMGAAQ